MRNDSWYNIPYNIIRYMIIDTIILEVLYHGIIYPIINIIGSIIINIIGSVIEITKCLYCYLGTYILAILKKYLTYINIVYSSNQEINNFTLLKLIYTIAIITCIMFLVIIIFLFSSKINNLRCLNKITGLYTGIVLTLSTLSNFKKINKGSSIVNLKYSNLDEVLIVGLISFYLHIICSVIACSLIYFIFDIFGIFLYFLIVVFSVIAKIFILNKDNLVLNKKNNYGKIKYIVSKLLYSLRLVIMTMVRAVTLFLRVIANITVGVALLTVLVHLLFNMFFELRVIEFLSITFNLASINIQFSSYLIYLVTYVAIPVLFIIFISKLIYYLSLYEILVIVNQIQLAATLIIIYVLEVNTY